MEASVVPSHSHLTSTALSDAAFDAIANELNVGMEVDSASESAPAPVLSPPSAEKEKATEDKAPAAKPKIEDPKPEPESESKLKPKPKPDSKTSAATTTEDAEMEDRTEKKKDKDEKKANPKNGTEPSADKPKPVTGPLATMQKYVNSHLRQIVVGCKFDTLRPVPGVDLRVLAPKLLTKECGVYLIDDQPVVRLTEIMPSFLSDLNTVAGLLLNVSFSIWELPVGTREAADKRRFYTLPDIQRLLGKTERLPDDDPLLTREHLPFFSNFFVPLAALLSRLTVHDKQGGGFGAVNNPGSVVSDCPFGTAPSQYSGLLMQALRNYGIRLKDFCKRVSAHLMARSKEAYYFSIAHGRTDDFYEEKENEDEKVKEQLAAAYTAATPYTLYLIDSIRHIFKAVNTSEKRKRKTASSAAAASADDDDNAEAEEDEAEAAKEEPPVKRVKTAKAADPPKPKAKPGPKPKPKPQDVPASKPTPKAKPGPKPKPRSEKSAQIADLLDEKDIDWDAEDPPASAAAAAPAAGPKKSRPIVVPDDEDSGITESLVKPKVTIKAKPAPKPKPKAAAAAAVAAIAAAAADAPEAEEEDADAAAAKMFD